MVQVWKARFGIFLVEPIDQEVVGRLDASNIVKPNAGVRQLFVRATTLAGETVAVLTIAELRQIALFQGFHDKRHQSIG